jgi:hypothetical protein
MLTTMKLIFFSSHKTRDDPNTETIILLIIFMGVNLGQCAEENIWISEKWSNMGPKPTA